MADEALPGTKKIEVPPHIDLTSEEVRRSLAHKLAPQFLPDYVFSSFDVDTRQAVFTLQRSASVLSSLSSGHCEVQVSSQTPLTNPRKLEAQFRRVLEADEDTYPRPDETRWYLSGVDAHTNRLAFDALTDRENHIRTSVASDVLRCPPWEVVVHENPDATIDLLLPTTYAPSKHDTLLADTIESKIGAFGWYHRVDVSHTVPGTTKFAARIIPADPPRFDPLYPLPAPVVRPSSIDAMMTIPVGVRLGAPGAGNTALSIDFNLAPHLMGSGQTRGGKSVGANCLMTQVLERGWELAVTTIANSASGFDWVKPFCRPDGYGCASKLEALTVLERVLEDVEARGAMLRDHGVSKWQELPGPVRAENPLTLVLVDEAPGLLTPRMSKATAKLLPEGTKQDDAMEEIAICALMASALSKLIAEAAKTGICVAVFGQAMNSASGGITPAMRQNLPHRLLFGTNPEASVLAYAFRAPKSVPPVPAHMVGADGDAVPAALRGVGLAELDGQRPCVFKGLFYGDTTHPLVDRLTAAGVPRHGDTTPSQSTQNTYRPAMERSGATPDVDDEDWSQTRSPISGRALSDIAHAMGDDWDIDETGARVTGFQKANLARHVSATTPTTP